MSPASPRLSSTSPSGKWITEIGHRLRTAFDWGMGILLVISIGWLGDTLPSSENRLFGLDHNASLLLASCAVLISALYLYWSRERFLPVRSLHSHSAPKAHKVLISCISPSSYLFEIHRKDDGTRSLRIKDKRDGAMRELQLTWDIEIDAENKQLSELHWNWQQILRGIRLHATKLERIYLIGSSEDERGQGSFDQLKQCAALLRGYLGDGTEIIPGNEAVDFEDLNALYHSLSGCISDAHNANYRADEIIIDATGGLKTTSIAAALVTLHNPRHEFQYIGNNGKALSYNVISRPRSELE